MTIVAAISMCHTRWVGEEPQYKFSKRHPTVTRFVTILVFRPLIHYAGGEHYRFDKWEDLVVIAYGGLRGTHSLLLALVIGHESELFRLNFTIKCVNYVSGVVFLSLLV